MKTKKILFICKHNVFRSKVAEAYFKKINKDKNIEVSSVGIIEADTLTEIEKSIVKQQREIAKRLGIDIIDSSRALKISLLSKQDMIVIVADDVQDIFTNKFYLKPNLKVITWKIPDILKGTKDADEFILSDIKEIMKKVDELSKQLSDMENEK